ALPEVFLGGTKQIGLAVGIDDRVDLAGGERVSNRTSTTLPRPATTAPTFVGLDVSFMISRVPPRVDAPVCPDGPRRFGRRPCHNKRQRGPECRDRPAGRHRWGTQRWRWSRCAPAAIPGSTPVPTTDSGSRPDFPWRGSSPLPS